MEALERAVSLKRLPQQIALGSMAKLEKLPLSQGTNRSEGKKKPKKYRVKRNNF